MENKNEIIEAEYREIDSCTLPEITAEIKYITESMNRTLLIGIIEIGKRFEIAKTLVDHGKWGEYCEKYMRSSYNARIQAIVRVWPKII